MSERTKYFRYNGLSHFQQETQVLQLFTDTNRPVQATITINPRQVGAIREALNALMLVLESGFIYRSTTGKGKSTTMTVLITKRFLVIDSSRPFVKQTRRRSWEWIQPFPSVPKGF